MPMSGIQKLIRFFTPRYVFHEIERESRQWVFHCDCGRDFSVWEIGGVRYRARGNPVKLVRCPGCQALKARRLSRG